LIVAVLTLPLGEADQALSEPLRGESFNFKKFKGATTVSTCLLAALKWPTKDVDITVALHQGISFLHRHYIQKSILARCLIPPSRRICRPEVV
jgi:hypothetical protein